MEILGYLHGAIAYESEKVQDASQARTSPTRVFLSTWLSLPWQRISSVSLLSLMWALSMCLSPAEPASAMILRHADRSADVTQLQQGLTQAGFYRGPITGYYGDLTQAAVRQFQQAQGLLVDGIAGPQTLAALQRYVPGVSFSGSSATASSNTSINTANPQAAPPVSASGLSVGSRGSMVTQLQVQLTQAGFYDGPITDYFGPRTQDAVLRFQQANGLPQTGVADSATLARLAQSTPSSTTAQSGRPFDVNSQRNSPTTGSGIASFNPQSTAGSAVAGGQVSAGVLLYRGDQGPAVTQLQESLRQVGVYRGPITGYYGSLTESAVYRFQQLNQVEPTGVAGPVTQQLIERSAQPI